MTALIEDMTFLDKTRGDDVVTARISNIDLGMVEIEYERTIVSHGGSHGVIYDVESAGMDSMTEEVVNDLITSGHWVLTSSPMVAHRDDDA